METKTLELQYVESSNGVDFLIYEVLDPTPLLCTLEDGRAKKYQNKAEMEANCKRIVMCVNAHEELVTSIDRISRLLNGAIHLVPTGEARNVLTDANIIALEQLQKITNTTPTEV